jgi:signal peptidase I
MEPTLQTGEYLLINKAAYFHVDAASPIAQFLPTIRNGSTRYVFGGPERGDVAVFQAPTQPDKDFIKRVIGLPGDMVQVKSGQVFVNGQALNEPYLEFTATYNYPISGQPIRVPDDSYFVLGDNRPNSSDSHLGWFVPVGNLIGKAWVAYWPPEHWGVMAHATYNTP